MKKNKYTKPQAYPALTKDSRFEGTFEVLIPVEGRVKPHRVPLQFPTQKAAEDWIHSPDGVEAIDEVLGKAGK
ncbi:MAG TPA: hypothetical protein VH000_09145 [Rhizomicrobium sp.]|jgi:hypothetical protein|nr:hypothetical protein [Rhizomicrobium sp.]